MKCSGCRFYLKSKINGNHCVCMGDKPCEMDYRTKKIKKLKHKKNEKWNRRN